MLPLVEKKTIESSIYLTGIYALGHSNRKVWKRRK